MSFNIGDFPAAEGQLCSKHCSYYGKSEDLNLLRAQILLRNPNKRHKLANAPSHFTQSHRRINMLSSTHLERVSARPDFVTPFRALGFCENPSLQPSSILV